MTKPEAHRLLNAAIQGAEVPESSITEALAATGDLDPCTPVLKTVDHYTLTAQGLN